MTVALRPDRPTRRERPRRPGRRAAGAADAARTLPDPGRLTTVAYVVFAPFIESAGFPPIAALLVAILVVLLPIELGVILRAGRDQPQRIRSVVPYRRPLPIRDWVWLVPVLIVAAFIGFGLSMAVEPASSTACSVGCRIGSCARSILDRVGDYSREAWLVTLGGVPRLERVSRADRRGAVLPRLPAAPNGMDGPLGASRQRQPLLALPLLVAVADHRQDPRVRPDGLCRALEGERLPGMVVHCSFNTLGIILVASLVLGRL